MNIRPERENVELDDTDLALLRLLQDDGRATHAALGKSVGMSAPSVHARIKRLEGWGVIRGYAAVVAPEYVGAGFVAFVRVLTEEGPDGFEPFERFVEREPQILECHDVDGEDSYLLKVRTASPGALRDLLARVRRLAEVKRTLTSVGLLTVKETPALPIFGRDGPAVEDGEGSDARG